MPTIKTNQIESEIHKMVNRFLEKEGLMEMVSIHVVLYHHRWTQEHGEVMEHWDGFEVDLE